MELKYYNYLSASDSNLWRQIRAPKDLPLGSGVNFDKILSRWDEADLNVEAPKHQPRVY
jgi:hypothetical protein